MTKSYSSLFARGTLIALRARLPCRAAGQFVRDCAGKALLRGSTKMLLNVVKAEMATCELKDRRYRHQGRGVCRDADTTCGILTIAPTINGIAARTQGCRMRDGTCAIPSQRSVPNDKHQMTAPQTVHTHVQNKKTDVSERSLNQIPLRRSRLRMFRTGYHLDSGSARRYLSDGTTELRDVWFPDHRKVGPAEQDTREATYSYARESCPGASP